MDDRVRRALLGDRNRVLRDPVDLLRLTFAGGAVVAIARGTSRTRPACRRSASLAGGLFPRAVGEPRLATTRRLPGRAAARRSARLSAAGHGAWISGRRG
jgi:hypothetical protein